MEPLFLWKGRNSVKNIDVYPTRIEIYPYPIPSKDDDIVRKCSTVYDRVTHKKYPIGCAYVASENKLIAMRGLDMVMLSKSLDSYPRYLRAEKSARMKYRYRISSPPRNKDQVRAIRFLTCCGEYQRLIRYSQQSLNTEPSFGKTYCSVSALMEIGLRAIIILHNSIVKDQWMSTLLEFTDIKKNRILDIQGAEKMQSLMEKPVDADIILILHQSITSYLHSQGYNKTKKWFNHLECGVKIIDEAHLFFPSTAQIDFCSNIEKNWYLTGTMTRSNPLEISLFKRYFSNTPAFGQDLNKTLNVIYEFIEYDSCPSAQFQAYILTQRGPNSSKFIEYAMEYDEYKTILNVMFYAIEKAKMHPGKILVIVPKIKAGEMVKDLLEEKYPDDIIRTLHSKHKATVNAETKEIATIIISTIGSLGTGADISGLRNMIIMEPYTSEVTANQLPKRLRPLPNGEYSYCYDLVDTGFECMVSMENKRTKFLRKCCKEVKIQQYQ